MTERTERKLAAILAADVAGYSRLVSRNEEATISALKTHRRDLIDPTIRSHRGRIANTAGDSLLVEFASAVDAVRCAVDIQFGMAQRNNNVPEDQRIVFRMGINVGDVIVQGQDLLGDGVNVAARLEQIAEPGGINLSRTVRDQIQDKLSFTFDALGEQFVKNIPRPVEVSRVRWEGYTPASLSHSEVQPKSVSGLTRRWVVLAVSGAAALAIIAAAGLGWMMWHERSAAEINERPGIAVLPFTNLSDDKEQDYFSDGITEDIIADLSRFSQLKVIAGNSTFRYKGKPIDTKQVRAELGVRYVLEGSVRRAGDQLRIASQLIDVETGGHIWAERYDRPLNAIFEIQDELTRAIVPLIVGNVLQEDLQRAAIKPTGNLTAYDLSLLGRKLVFAYNPADLEKGREAFEKAIAADPAYSDALVGLATVYTTGYFQRWGKVTGPEALDEATKLLNRAVSLSPRSAEAWSWLGFLKVLQRRFDEGISALEKARQLNPNSTTVQTNLAAGYMYVGRFEDAVQEYTDALKRDPFPLPVFHGRLCSAYFMLRRYDLALAECGRAIEQAPKFRTAFRLRAAIYVELGDLAKAKIAIAEVLKLSPTTTVTTEMESLPFKSHAHQERLAVALKKAGLPE